MKKCLITLLVGLLAGAVSFSLMAQEPNNGSVSTKTDSYFWTYVVCDGVLVDGPSEIRGRGPLQVLIYLGHGKWRNYRGQGLV